MPRPPAGRVLPAALALAAFTLAVAAFAALPGAARAAGDPREDLAEANRVYRASLERVIPFYEGELRRASDVLDRYTDFYARGIVARRDVEEAAAIVARARGKLGDAHREIAQSDTLAAEIEAQREAAAGRKLGEGEYEATDRLVRFQGPRAGAIAELVRIRDFFVTRFGRPLPVSALGQTAVHHRLGLDHQHAVDVAVHPDTPEGRALMAYLRELGLTFFAYRGPIPGAATGAHIHIGRPSERNARRP
jgi:hypothetical protein